jgi:hypothetical protein
MSREAPKLDQEPVLEVAVRNRFQCVHHRRLIETACLRGRGLVVRRRAIRVNPRMQVEMIVTVVVVVGAHAGRLRRTVDTSVRVVMGLHVMSAVTTVTRSTLHHLKTRIRTRCADCSLQGTFPLFYSSPFFFRLYMVVLRVLCDDNVDVRVHRRAGSRVRLHLVRERACLCLSRTWPSSRPDAAILANVASTGPFAPVAASPRTSLPDLDRGATATAGIEGSQYVREAWPARIAGRQRVVDLCRGGTHHNATTSA